MPHLTQPHAFLLWLSQPFLLLGYSLTASPQPVASHAQPLPAPPHTLPRAHRAPFHTAPLQPASPQDTPFHLSTPQPSPSPPQVSPVAAGPSRRHTGRTDPPAALQMLEIQQGILTEVRSIREGIDRVGSQMEAMTTMLEVIANALAEVAARRT